MEKMGVTVIGHPWPKGKKRNLGLSLIAHTKTKSWRNVRCKAIKLFEKKKIFRI